MDLKIFTDNIEQEAKDQIELLLSQDAFKDCKVRIMPDVHAGKGCVIGFTANLGDKVIPNLIGVDIGCGVRVAELGKIDIDFEKLDTLIRERIPSGRNVRIDCGEYIPLLGLHCKSALKNIEWINNSLGTLGGGNHFMEVDEDIDGNKYLVVHTGSRNLGKQVAEYYQTLAVSTLSGSDEYEKRRVKLIKEYKESGRQNEISQALAALKAEQKKAHPNIPADLCYLTGEYRERYLHDMRICQEFAIENRSRIVWEIVNGIGWYADNIFESVHNYLDLQNNIIRKGAISAKKRERLIIPINMRDGAIIGVGKGNKDWNESAPHGAGRIMSRMKARATLGIDDYKQSMNGIYTTSVSEATIDEAPMAYKPIEEIVRNIEPTVSIEKIIRPVYNFKAAD